MLLSWKEKIIRNQFFRGIKKNREVKFDDKPSGLFNKQQIDGLF